MSTLTEKASNELHLPLREPERHLSGADGNKLGAVGVADVSIESRYKSVDAPVCFKRFQEKPLGND